MFWIPQCHFIYTFEYYFYGAMWRITMHIDSTNSHPQFHLQALRFWGHVNSGYLYTYIVLSFWDSQPLKINQKCDKSTITNKRRDNDVTVGVLTATDPCIWWCYVKQPCTTYLNLLSSWWYFELKPKIFSVNRCK